MTTISDLLAEVYLIQSKHLNDSKAKGTTFNIFNVLKLESDEVGLHSRLIGNLLNPKGAHGQGVLFLKWFVETLNTKNHPLEYTDAELSRAIVIVEEYVGKVADDYSKGGRIDIVVRFPTMRPIVIENKIYAGDQPKQLWRYKQEYPDCNLIYLTLKGVQPSANSCHQILIEDVHCISYQHHIINWLNKCMEGCMDKPAICETLNQYVNLLENMTDQAQNNSEQETMNLVFKSKENLSAAFQIISIEDEIKQKIVSVWAEEIKKIAEGIGFSVEYSPNEIGHDGTEIIMRKSGSDLAVSLYFEGSSYYLIAGVFIDGLDDQIRDEQREKYADKIARIRNRKVLKNYGYKYWVWVTAVDEFNDLEWEEVLDTGDISKVRLLIEGMNNAFFS